MDVLEREDSFQPQSSQETVRTFARDEIAPKAAENDKTGESALGERSVVVRGRGMAKDVQQGKPTSNRSRVESCGTSAGQPVNSRIALTEGSKKKSISQRKHFHSRRRKARLKANQRAEDLDKKREEAKNPPISLTYDNVPASAKKASTKLSSLQENCHRRMKSGETYTDFNYMRFGKGLKFLHVSNLDKKVEDTQPAASFLAGQKSFATKEPYARTVAEHLVRMLSEEQLASFRHAVENGDTEFLPCIPFPSGATLRVSSRKVPVHLAVVRAWKLRKAEEDQLVKVGGCAVETGHVCLNPFHYDKKATKFGGNCCVVVKCSSNTVSSPDLSFYRLPQQEKNDELYRKYLSSCGRADLDKTGFLPSHRICGLHFFESDIDRSKTNPSLLPGAIPTLCLPKVFPLSAERKPVPKYDSQVQLEIQRRKVWCKLTARENPDGGYNFSAAGRGWQRLTVTNREVVFAKCRMQPLPQDSVATDVIRLYRHKHPALWANGILVPLVEYDSSDSPGPPSTSQQMDKLFSFQYLNFDKPPEVPNGVPLPKPLIERCRELLDSMTEILALVAETSDAAEETGIASQEDEEFPEDSTKYTDAQFKQQVYYVLRFGKELLENALVLFPRRRRYSFWMIRLCSIFKILSRSAYSFIRNTLSQALPHVNCLRSYSEPNDIKAGLDFRFMERLSSEVQALKEKDREVILVSDCGYGTEKYEYSGGKMTGIACNKEELTPAKNVLLFMVQSICGKFRRVVSYHFVKDLVKIDMKNFLVAVIVMLEEKTPLRVQAWGCDQGAENQGAKNLLVRDAKAMPWRFPNPADLKREIIILPDISHVIKRIWASFLRLANGRVTHLGEDFLEFSLFEDLYEIEKDRLIRYAKDLTRKFLYPTVFEKMDAAIAEKLISEHNLATLRMMVENPKHPLFLELLKRTNSAAQPQQQRINAVLRPLTALRELYLPLIVMSPHQHVRYHNRLLEAMTKENLDEKLWSGMAALEKLKPSTNTKMSLPKTTYDALQATFYGSLHLAEISLQKHDIAYVCPGKLRSDNIEHIMAALRCHYTQINPAKVPSRLSALETFTAMSKSSNVSSFHKIKKRRVLISDDPLPKRARQESARRDHVLNSPAELGMLNLAFNDPEPFYAGDIYEEMRKFGETTWSCVQVIDIVNEPWEKLGTDSTFSTGMLFDAYSEEVADAMAAICRTVPEKTAGCKKCRELILEQFDRASADSNMYIGMRFRDGGNLKVPHRKLYDLAFHGVLFFYSLSRIRSFWNSESHLTTALKLLFLKMDLSSFHPLSEICDCGNTRFLEYMCLHKLYNLLFDSFVKRKTDVADGEKLGRKSKPMSAEPKKLAKLSQKSKSKKK